MKYYPISRVITGSKATGNDFYLNGKVYTGPYYRTWDNKYFTGNDPVTGTSQELTFIPESKRTGEETSGIQADYTISDVGNAQTYNEVKKITPLELQGFSSINPYYPIVTSVDYRRGFFFRYFAKKRNENGNVIETNQDIHLSLQLVNSPYNYELYHSIEVYWQLTGPLHDTVNPINGARTAGIVETNTRITQTKNETFKGLVDYIGGNYTKFTRPVG